MKKEKKEGAAKAKAAYDAAKQSKIKKSVYYQLNLDFQLTESYGVAPVNHIVKGLFKKLNTSQLTITQIIDGLTSYFEPFIELEREDIRLLSYLLVAHEMNPTFKKNGYVSRSYYAMKIDTGNENIGQSIHNLKEAGLIIVDSGYGKERANHYIFPSGVMTLIKWMLSRLYEANNNIPTKKPEKSDIEKFLGYQIALKNNEDIFGGQ